MRAPVRGLASGQDVRESMSAEAMRRKAAATRPGLPIYRTTPVSAYGIEVARHDWIPWRRFYASVEDVTLVVAGPRRGKTQQVANAIIDASGAVVATSTRADIFLLTAPCRSGQPMYVMNPHGLGGIASSLHFDLIGPCVSPEEASLRATALLSGARATNGLEGSDFWEGAAHSALSRLLHAAALSGRGPDTLYAWALDWSDDTPVKVLQGDRRAAKGWDQDLEQLHEMYRKAEKTAQGVITALRPSLAFMSHESTAELVRVRDGARTMDPETFIREGGTLYLLGADRKHSGIAPLFSVLTTVLFETGKRIAAQNATTLPGNTGRLDPPLFFALDEAALICPVPLERWMAEAGGSGMPVMVLVQSLTQLEETWGREGAAIIRDLANVTVIHGGGTIPEHLEQWSKLCGSRSARVVNRTVSESEDGDRKSRSVSVVDDRPVLSPDRLRRLGRHRCVVLHGDQRPVVGRVRMAYKRRDVRRAAARRGIAPPTVYDDDASDVVVPLASRRHGGTT